MRIIDWSSDVCSSDLSPGKLAERQQPGVMPLPAPKPIEAEERKPEEQSQIAIKREARSNDEPVIHVSAHREGQMALDAMRVGGDDMPMGVIGRSEERRGGKECVSTCRSRWAP